MAAACEWLEAAGVRQYEISNFAREGLASRHNVKYWRREPYVGFGLDAHSMLRSGRSGCGAVGECGMIWRRIWRAEVPRVARLRRLRG